MVSEYGESFERYYRAELIAQHGTDGLDVLPPLPLGRPREISSSLGLELRHERAENLARTLYSLSNERWESNVNVYLRTIDQLLSGATVSDSYSCLTLAKEKFESLFGESIRERGESVDIVDQIVKRTGEETRNRMQRVLDGVDPDAEALRLLDSSLNRESRGGIYSELKDYTKNQVVAIRESCVRLCVQRVHNALQDRSDESDTSNRKAGNQKLRSLRDYLSKVHARRSANRPELDAFEFEYAFAGRQDKDILLLGHWLFPDAEDDSAIRSQLISYITQNFPSLIPSRLGQRLEYGEEKVLLNELGLFFQERRFAAAHKEYSVVEKFVLAAIGRTEKAEDKLLQRRRFLAKQWSSDYTQLEYVASLRTLFSGFSKEVVQATWKEIAAKFGLQFSLQHFLPVQYSTHERALLIAEILDNQSVTYDAITEILELLTYLNPWDAADLNALFLAETGETLISQLTERISPDLVPRRVLSRIVEGSLRLPFDFDLVAEARGWQREAEEESSHRTLAVPLFSSLRTVLMDEQTGVERKISSVLATLSKRTSGVLREFTLRYLEDSPQRRPFAVEVRQALGARGVSLLRVVRIWQNPIAFLDSFRENPLTLSALDRVSPIVLKNLAQFAKQRGIQSFSRGQASVNSGFIESAQLVLYESFRFLLEACDLHDGIQPESIDGGKTILRLLDLDPDDLLHTERLYNFLFGSLRSDVKSAFQANVISESECAQFILRLEGVNPDILSLIEETFESQNLTLLSTLLNENLQAHAIITELYRFLKGQELRTSIEEHWTGDERVSRASLLCLGYAPDLLAQKLREAILENRGAELGKVLLALLMEEGSAGQIAVVPDDENWRPQMMEQTRLSYHERFGPGLVDDLRTRGVPDKELHKICYRLFGTDCAEMAVRLYTLLVEGDDAIERFAELLRSADSLLIRRVTQFFAEFFDQSAFAEFERRRLIIEQEDRENSQDGE
jgi:hypothetical protein